MSNSTKLARATIRQLIENGVSDFVLSPGSRNAPLSLALYEAEKAGLVNLHIRIDERGAGFFALGIAKASHNYVALICTSGTAVANYHPAAMEAFHADIPLLFLTADRPARLRNTGANQTTNQVGALLPLTTHDTSSELDLSELMNGSPLHINLQFDEPLLAESDENWLDGITPQYRHYGLDSGGEIQITPKTVVIVGHDRGGYLQSEIGEFVDGVPHIAEDPLSFPDAIPHAALFLADEKVREYLKPDQVIVVGRTTLSRSINAYIANAPRTIVIDPRISNIDTNRSADEIHLTLPDLVGSVSEQWQNLWRDVKKSVRISLEWSEQEAIRTIAASLPDEAALFIGSSRPVRDFEASADPRSGISVFANRGLAGIDGNLSTALGIATQFDRSYSVIGDLTFLHDLSSLVNLPSLNHTCFIVDNNGGGIFSTLPQAGVDGFEKIFGTPHNLNVESIIRGFGYSVEKVKTVSDLTRSLHHAGLHFVIVEVPDRATNGLVLKELHQRVASAVRMGSNFA